MAEPERCGHSPNADDICEPHPFHSPKASVAAHEPAIGRYAISGVNDALYANKCHKHAEQADINAIARAPPKKIK